jgi:hypothetical protein
VNWLLLPTLAVGGLMFVLGVANARRVRSGSKALIAATIAVLLSLPGLLFVVYYSGILGEPVALYRWRAMPWTELSSGGVGFLAGILQVWLIPRLKLSRIGTRALAPGLTAFVLALPYLKPVCQPLNHARLTDRWSDGVCLQSSESTCGPACTATLLKLSNRSATEREIAVECFSSKTGTENWYLARALSRRGVQPRFVRTQPQPEVLPWPAIAGVRLHPEYTGHFIAVLRRDSGNYVIGDPLTGRESLSLDELRERYFFTGFFLCIQER